MARTVGWWCLAVALLACSDAESVRNVPPPPAIPRDAPGGLAEAPPMDAALAEAPLLGPPAPLPRGDRKRGAWSDIVTGDGCFYFSGPDGRDTQLRDDIAIAIDGDRAVVTWSGVVFEGTLREDVLDVKRTGRYDFNGPWTTTERLRGPYREGVLHGTYTYEECERGSTCPGPCKISARVVVR